MHPQPACHASPRHEMTIAILSHELKTPLVALLGFAQLLESDTSQPLAEVQRERAERIEQAGREMLAVVNELLAGARRGSTVAALHGS